MSSKDFVSSFFKPFSGARLPRGKIAATLATCIICFAASDGNAAANRIFEYLPAPSVMPAWPAADAGASQGSFDDRFEFPQTPFVSAYTANPLYSVTLPPLTMASLPREWPRQEIVAAGPALVGIASTYDPTDPLDLDAGKQEMASGEHYDINGWTAAIRTDLRAQFGGVRFGRNYVPTFALVQSGDKQLIVKINDVGPLKPGRIIDLNKRAMQYFDPTLQKGLIADVRVTPLAGQDWALGPVESERPVSIAGYFAP
jgi:rare lipoprotein A